VPYYISLVLIAAYIGIIEYIGKSALVVAMIYITQYVGRLIPTDSQNLSSRNIKYHNSHFYHMVPLLANIFGTWGVIAYSWIRYDRLTITTE
jgi:hypothetical protein